MTDEQQTRGLLARTAVAFATLAMLGFGGLVVASAMQIADTVPGESSGSACAEAEGLQARILRQTGRLKKARQEQRNCLAGNIQPYCEGAEERLDLAKDERDADRLRLDGLRLECEAE